MHLMNVSDIVQLIDADTVTPKQFAYVKTRVEARAYSLRSAQQFFESLIPTGHVWRAGTPTPRYPKGKMMMMKRETALRILQGERL